MCESELFTAKYTLMVPIPIVSIESGSLGASSYNFICEVKETPDSTPNRVTISSQCGRLNGTPSKMNSLSYALGTSKGRKHLEEGIAKTVNEELGCPYDFEEYALDCAESIGYGISRFSQMVFDDPTMFDDSAFSYANPPLKRVELVCQQQGMLLKLGDSKVVRHPFFVDVDVLSRYSCNDNSYHGEIITSEADIEFINTI